MTGISGLYKNTKGAKAIKDSGDRTKFPSGAVRDMREGKGRCDLLPLDVVATLLENPIILKLHCFQILPDVKFLMQSLRTFTRLYMKSEIDMILEVAKHFEEGAKKYGDDNWKKGIPVSCYIDSAIRHYLKFKRGDQDEPHDRAFCWNVICAIWTCDHMPELNDYKKEEGAE